MTDYSETPWKRARENQRSQRQEKRLAKLPGGRQQLNSGRHWFSKRDVSLNGFLVEARTTKAESYSLSRVEFAKLTKDAFGSPPGQLPGMQIDFECADPLHLFVMRLEDHQAREQRIALLEAALEEAKRGAQEA